MLIFLFQKSFVKQKFSVFLATHIFELKKSKSEKILDL